MAKGDLNTLYCADCGSSEGEMKMWVNPNTGISGAAYSDRLDEENCWCDCCKRHVQLLTLEELWDKFSEVPVNNDDEIEENFLLFPTGTDRFDVWHWFDDRCPNNLHDDLLYPSDD